MHDNEKLVGQHYRDVKSNKYNKFHIQNAIRTIGIPHMRNYMFADRARLSAYEREFLDPKLWKDFVFYLTKMFELKSEEEIKSKTPNLPRGWIQSVPPGKYINIFSNIYIIYHGG